MNTQRLGFFSKYGTPIAVVAALALVVAIAPTKAPVATNEFADASDVSSGDVAGAADEGSAVTDTGAVGDTTEATVLGVTASRQSTSGGGGSTTRSGGTAGGATSGGAAAGGSATTSPGGSAGGGGTATTAPADAPRFGGATAATAGADCTRLQVLEVADYGCKAPFSGSNGGVTHSKGITADTVRAVYYIGNTGATFAEEPAQAATVCGIPNATPEEFDRTIEVFNHFLNKNYQTYGRKVDYKVFRAQALSTDSAATRAEAVKIDQDLKPFVLVNSFANEVVDETARRGIMNFGGVGLSGAFLKSHAPYVFQLGHDTDTGNELMAEYIAKRVHPYPTKWTGDDATQGPGKSTPFSPPRGVQRKYAIVYPGDAAQQLTTIGTDLASRLQRWGVPASQMKTYGYQSDASTWPTQALNLVGQMRSDGITNVLFLVNPVFISHFTGAANNQFWYPEYIVTDFATQSSSGTWRAIAGGPVVGGKPTFAQGKRAFGLLYGAAPSEVFEKCNASPTERRLYNAFKWAAADLGKPTMEPASGFVIPFLGLWVTAQAIENAGPRLDPGTFRDGMWKIKVIPPTTRTDNLFGYGPGDYSGSQDAVEVWFNPTKNTRKANDPPGEFEYVADGMRYSFGQFPKAETEAFRPECLGPGGCGTAPKWPGR